MRICMFVCICTCIHIPNDIYIYAYRLSRVVGKGGKDQVGVKAV